MDSQLDDYVPSDVTTTIPPLSDKHTHTVIFLHGREDFGEDLAQCFFYSTASDGRSLAEIFPSFKWVFPTAKLRFSAQREFEFSSSSFAELLKGQENISQWFDVWDIKTPEEKQELMIPGLQESIRDIVDIICEESEEVPQERIVLGGISQGCATAVYTMLSSGLKLGGFVGLSSWLPFQHLVETIPEDSDDVVGQIQKILEISNEPTANLDAKIPVFLSHSKDDETVPFSHGQGLCKNIRDLGFDVTWKEYEDGRHWIHADNGVNDISTFLRKILNV